ncbi:MAG TPA: BTAD domain-containing putative transcriptional regulator, partial [Acidimicrobiales bacterium]|nr:BTAD domain-containing putative transcriptional regulator [Acidimicrobiales bacterium]
MRYRILGPLEVLRDDGTPVALGGGRERTVLCALLLDANRVVSRDRLIEAVWGSRAPETAANTLQVHVSKLRKALGGPGADGPIHTEAPGYVLRVAPGELDAEEFERLVSTPPPGESPDGAARRLGAALALWRGRVLDGLDVATFALGELTRLDELRLAALESRLAAQLAVGEHRAVTGELEGLVRDHPLREELRRLHMLALYRSGRQADALASYGEARQLLADELGIDPSPVLQSLELAILNQSADLELDRDDPSPAATHATRASSLAHAAVPLPRPLEAAPPVGLLGREPELAAISAAYERVAKRDGCEFVLVSGESGLGKTTLVAAAARAAHADGACILFGHTAEDLATPYQLFAEALGHVAASVTDAQLVRGGLLGAAELVRLVPALAGRIPDLAASRATDADAERYLLFTAVTELLAELSAERVVVLVLDDLQWADRASLLLLQHLASTPTSLRVLVAATYRGTELGRADALVETLGALHRHAEVTRLELQGLGDADVVSYVEAVSGHALDAAGVGLAHALHRETDGNPFFVGQLVRHLTETGALRRDDEGRWTADDRSGVVVLPVSVREVVGARVVRLGRDASRTLSLASVIGREFDVDLLARATGTPHDELLDQLDAAEGAALVRDLAEGHYAFTHALIQRTLYEDLRPTRRASAHRVVAEALEELCGDAPGPRVAELAHHFCQATQPVDLTKAVEYSARAGDAALAALAPHDAASHYAQALELLGRVPDADDAERTDLAIRLGTAQRQAGNAAFRTTLLDAARRAMELGDGPRLVAAALANDRGTFSTVDALDADKVEVLERALAHPGLEDGDRAQLLAILCSESTVGTTLEHRQALAEEAVALASATGDDDTIVRVLNHVLLPLAVPPLMDQVVAWSIEGLERAARVGDPIQLCSAASGRRFTAACTGDLAEMDRCFAIKAPLVAQLGQPFLAWVEALQRATRALIAGDPDEAERLAGEALALGT